MTREHLLPWSRGLALPKGSRPEWRCGFLVRVHLPWNAGTVDALAGLGSLTHDQNRAAMSASLRTLGRRRGLRVSEAD